MAVRTGNWKQNGIIDGNAFQVTVGTFSTPIQGGGAGTVFDQDQPELYISVPSGTGIMPLRIRVDCQTPLIAADSDECEILIAVDRTQAITDGTGTTETPFNMRTDLTSTNRASLCTVKSACTGNTTNPSLSAEFSHRVIVADVQGTPANALWGSLYEEWEPGQSPVIIGPATLLVYWGGTVATSGFCSASWLEMPTASWTT